MNGYKCIYNGKCVDVYAATSYAAQQAAALLLKVTSKNQYKISVCLCEKADGEQVTHTITN